MLDRIAKAIEVQTEECEIATSKRELATYRPIFWFELPEGPERDLLQKEQEQPDYKHLNR